MHANAVRNTDMALRLVNRSLRLASPRPTLAASRGAPAAFGLRSYATVDDKEVDPKTKATSIIDALPGNSVISKTGYLTVGTGLATWLISKEIYVVNEETLIAVSFAGLVIAVYRSIKQPYIEWADEEIKKVINVMAKAREDHKLAITDRIESASKLRDVVDVTKGLFALSKETAQLEHETFGLKQKIAVSQEIKSVLNSWVRYEANIRDAEQKKLVSYLADKIQADLQDSKVQQQLLQQAIADVEKLVNVKA